MYHFLNVTYGPTLKQAVLHVTGVDNAKADAGVDIFVDTGSDAGADSGSGAGIIANAEVDGNSTLDACCLVGCFLVKMNFFCNDK